MLKKNSMNLEYENSGTELYLKVTVGYVREKVMLGSLRRPRRQWQRERRRTKALMSRIAVHVRYNSWYISLPSSAKQEHEMIKFCVVWRT